jgi:hypothetical protein
MSFQSVTFNADGSVSDSSLESHVRPANAMSDGAKAQVNIRTNTSDFASYNTGAGAATHGPSTQSVQLGQPTDLVKAPGGRDVKPEVLEILKKIAPDMFIEPATAPANEAAKEAKAEETTREELNRHPGGSKGTTSTSPAKSASRTSSA